MNSELRLVEMLNALDELGAKYLVMGGHAVRYYGVQRNTDDYDLHIVVDDWEKLDEFLNQSPYFASLPLVEGASWRPHDFRRFMVGRWPDGREEWLEFWRTNHLLPPFPENYARREEGEYGGRQVAFLSLPDLIRSKETERNSDWLDVALLEEIQDARLLARNDPSTLANLRSRKGMEVVIQRGLLADVAAVRTAFETATCPITRAILAPAVDRDVNSNDEGAIGKMINGDFRSAQTGSSRHLALVESVRRLYKEAAIRADRLDKAKERAS